VSATIVGLVDLGDHSVQQKSKVSLDEPLFEALPPRLDIEEYQPFASQEFKIQLRNKDTVLLRQPVDDFSCFSSSLLFTHLSFPFSLCLFSSTQVTRRVKIDPPQSHYFSLAAPSRNLTSTSSSSSSSSSLLSSSKSSNDGSSSSVAPGMSVTYTLTFRPHEKKEYQCDLVVVTEREKFIIPVRVSSEKGLFFSFHCFALSF
jgi:hydrocephalus-inducing protein